MPRADFRLSGGLLDLHAPVKVLAVMCHPASARDREALLRHPPAKITVPRTPQAPEAPQDLWTGELWEKFILHRHVAALAGALALALAQLSAFGQPGERRTVVPLAGIILAKWQRVVDERVPKGQNTPQAGQSETLILDAFEVYRSVSHLWAAVVYGMVQGRPDLHPSTVGQLPSFLAYAEEIARLATSLTWRETGGELVLESRSLWSFVLPAGITKKAEALPFGETDETAPLAEKPRPPRTPN